jgi:hypothetical protein
MKKRIVTIGIFALLAALAGAQAKGTSFIIKDGASLWSLKGKAMTWVASLPIGEPLVSVAKGTSGGTYKDAEYNLAKVKTENGDEGYVIDDFVARDAMGLAVVTNSLATLYSQARDSSVLATIVPRMNVIAVWAVPGKSDFMLVAGYAADTGLSFSEKFLLTSDISVNEKDVNTALLLQAIKEQKKKEQKQKTLQIINQKYAGSAFGATVGELKAALDTESLVTEEFASVLTATDTVNIRDIPSVYGTVVVAVKKGEKVTGTVRTSAEYTVSELKGRWVKVSLPKEGWVFDAYFTAE